MLTNTNHSLGSFIGSNYDHGSLDALMAFSFQPKDIETTRGLNESKWWDYRYVHPGYAFFHFADEYRKAVDRWRTMFGIDYKARLSANEHPIWRTPRKTRGSITTVTGKPVLAPAAYRTSMWRAMCFADSYGVPYDRWIGIAFEYAFECKWERIPQPSGLYGTGMISHIIDRWAREQADIMKLPVDPRFLNENYQGHRWQDAHNEWLLDLIGKRPLPHLPLAQYLYREHRLPMDLAVKRLGQDTVDRALTSATFV